MKISKNQFENILKESIRRAFSLSEMEASAASNKKQLTLYKVNSLSDSNKDVLTTKDGNSLFIYEDGVLYDSEDGVKKGPSHRMSKIDLIILPYAESGLSSGDYYETVENNQPDPTGLQVAREYGISEFIDPNSIIYLSDDSGEDWSIEFSMLIPKKHVRQLNTEQEALEYFSRQFTSKRSSGPGGYFSRSYVDNVSSQKDYWFVEISANGGYDI